MEFKIETIDQLDGLAEELIQHFKHNIILLEGDLGAGKTTLIKSILKKLGSTDEVSSPTFSIVNEYETSNGKIFHFDLYRIKSTEEALDFGVEEYLDSKNYCFIEWPDVILDLLPEEFHRIKIKSEEGLRTINFS